MVRIRRCMRLFKVQPWVQGLNPIGDTQAMIRSSHIAGILVFLTCFAFAPSASACEGHAKSNDSATCTDKEQAAAQSSGKTDPSTAQPRARLAAVDQADQSQNETPKTKARTDRHGRTAAARNSILKE